MDNQLRGLAVDKQGTDSHGSFQLERLPVGGVEGQRDGVVVDAGLGLLAQLHTLGDEVYQLAGNRNLAFGLFAERHADGVADALGQQGTNAHGRLDAAVFSLAGLCDA